MLLQKFQKIHLMNMIAPSIMLFLSILPFPSSGNAADFTYTLIPKVEEKDMAQGEAVTEAEAEMEILTHALVRVRDEDNADDSDKTAEIVPPAPALDANFSPKLISEYLNIFNTILVFGEKVWKLVEQNAAVLKVENRAISVLPNILDQKVTPMDLEKWQLPKNKVFHFTGYSNFGNVLADMVYTLHFNYGGQHNGQGQYLAGVDITPSKVYVKWSNSLEVKSELKSVVNLGTQQDPLVAATVEVSFKLETPFSTRLMTDLITVIGNGEIVLGQQNISAHNL